MLFPRWLYWLITRLASPWILLANLPGKFLPKPLTAPFYYPKALFAMRLLFYNQYKFHYTFATARLESKSGVHAGDSILATEYHNLFGIGIKASSYAVGQWDSKKVGEPKFAIYRNDFDCVYDYYLIIYKKSDKSIRYFYDEVPKTEFAVNSIANDHYVKRVAGAMGGCRYYCSDPDERSETLLKLEKNQSNYYIQFWIGLIGCALSSLVVFRFVRYLYLRFYKKQKVKFIDLSSVKSSFAKFKKRGFK